MSISLNQQLVRLSSVMSLEARARRASAIEMPFVMVNETLQAVAYRQAALWLVGKRGIAAMSGVSAVEGGVPYAAWLMRVVASQRKSGDFLRIHVVDRTALPTRVRDAWQEWLPPHLLWCPMLDRKGRLTGALMFAREEEWEEGDMHVLSLLVEAYAHGLAAALSPVRPLRTVQARTWVRRLALASVLGGTAFLGTLPVRSSILAPAEVVPEHPAVVRAPFAGVIGTMLVRPNEVVTKGQPVARLDERQLRTQYEVARKLLDTARAEYQQASQEAMQDMKARVRASLLSGKIAEQEAEASYRRQMLERADILAPADGVAAYDDPSDWVGRPVEQGERLMLVSPPLSTRLDVEVPVGEAITFTDGSDVVFFDDLDPDHPKYGKLVLSSYGSAMTPEGVLSYSLKAELSPGMPLRLGLKGTAKVFGPERPLALWLLRKPIATARQWLMQ